MDLNSRRFIAEFDKATLPNLVKTLSEKYGFTPKIVIDWESFEYDKRHSETHFNGLKDMIMDLDSQFVAKVCIDEIGKSHIADRIKEIKISNWFNSSHKFEFSDGVFHITSNWGAIRILEREYLAFFDKRIA